MKTFYLIFFAPHQDGPRREEVRVEATSRSAAIKAGRIAAKSKEWRFIDALTPEENTQPA